MIIPYLLFFSSLLFVEYILFTSIFAFGLKRRKHFLLLSVIYIFFFFALILGLNYIGYKFIEHNSFSYSSIQYVHLFSSLLILFVYSLFFLLFNEKIHIALFAATASSISHLMFSSIYNVFLLVCDRYSLYTFFIDGFDWISLLLYLTVLLLSLWFVVFFLSIPFFRFRKEDYKTLNSFISVIFFFSMAILMFFQTNVMVSSSGNKTVSFFFYAVEFLFCLVLLFVQHFMLVWGKDLNEKKALENFDEAYRKQTEMMNKNMETINIKVHDLRHQISGKASQASLDSEFKKELLDVVSIYDTHMNTGNRVLDSLLQQKALVCDVNDIQFVVMLDGKKMDFLSVSDMTSLFGNALDNAIEQETKEDKEVRFVHVVSQEKDSILSVTIENYCSNKPLFGGDGLPMTSKAKEYHGFGTKSIKSIVEKYGGVCSFQWEKGTFILNFLFFR